MVSMHGLKLIKFKSTVKLTKHLEQKPMDGNVLDECEFGYGANPVGERLGGYRIVEGPHITIRPADLILL